MTAPAKSPDTPVSALIPLTRGAARLDAAGHSARDAIDRVELAAVEAVRSSELWKRIRARFAQELRNANIAPAALRAGAVPSAETLAAIRAAFARAYLAEVLAAIAPHVDDAISIGLTRGRRV